MYNFFAKSTIRIQVFAVVIGLLLMLLKFLAWYLTASNAILTDALESIVNVVAGGFALYSLILSNKPKDEDHPYGHGKIEFLSAGFEASLISLAGVSILMKSVYNIFYPTEITQVDMGIVLIAITGLANFFLGDSLEKKGKASNSLTLIASGKHLKTDAYTSVGLIFGLFLLYLTGWVFIDNVMAIIFGGLILYTGFTLLRESVAGIMDEADPKLIEAIIENLDQKRKDDWIDIHNFRIIKYGASLHVDCHMTLPWYFNARECHNEIDAFEVMINEVCEMPVELFIHVDPCEPISCSVCQKKDCAIRKAVFTDRVTWTAQNTMRNTKHKIVTDKS